MDIEIIELAVNPDHVHLFFKYPPKYSLSYISKKIKGVSSRILRQEFPHLKEWCGEHLWAPSCFHGSVGSGWDVVSRYIETQDVHHAKNAGKTQTSSVVSAKGQNPTDTTVSPLAM